MTPSGRSRLRHGLRDAGLKPSKAGDEFAAFLAVERGEEISVEEFAGAWQEIEQALKNLFGMTDLLSELHQAEFVMAQRALQFKHGDVTVKAVPDLVAFYRTKPPLIVDWKVHFFGGATTGFSWRRTPWRLPAARHTRTSPAAFAAVSRRR